ncbi:hypothetical protein CCR97_24120 [Rhodoplanes elegans]|uniref:Uncharacterized protein n=1 Tax=Rhodoplanes elegans TaxID=29408 RepID=A0A327KXG2_9BRAD|nr:hypothetical protein [Rhodoplanes elegans]MBK5961267.1 hypothetical protein [Rhodoplanes elegans]RAI41902.1 hypothetical protein CH338_01540 [Rhodoplanes elegans]
MTEVQIRNLLERTAEWPAAAQEELIRVMTDIENRYSAVYHVDDEDRAALNRSQADVEAGRFASDQDIKATFERFNLGRA